METAKDALGQCTSHQSVIYICNTAVKAKSQFLCPVPSKYSKCFTMFTNLYYHWSGVCKQPDRCSSWPLVKVKKLVKELFNFSSPEDQCNGTLFLGQQSQSCTHAEQSNLFSKPTGLHLLLLWIGYHQNVSRNCLW